MVDRRRQRSHRNQNTGKASTPFGSFLAKFSFAGPTKFLASFRRGRRSTGSTSSTVVTGGVDVGSHGTSVGRSFSSNTGISQRKSDAMSSSSYRYANFDFQGDEDRFRGRSDSDNTDHDHDDNGDGDGDGDDLVDEPTQLKLWTQQGRVMVEKARSLVDQSKLNANTGSNKVQRPVTSTMKLQLRQRLPGSTAGHSSNARLFVSWKGKYGRIRVRVKVRFGATASPIDVNLCVYVC